MDVHCAGGREYLNSHALGMSYANEIMLPNKEFSSSSPDMIITKRQKFTIYYKLFIFKSCINDEVYAKASDQI